MELESASNANQKIKEEQEKFSQGYMKYLEEKEKEIISLKCQLKRLILNLLY